MKIFNTAVTISSLFLICFGCKAPQGTSSLKADGPEPTFKVEIKFVDGVTLIKPLSDNLAIEKVIRIRQMTEINGGLEQLKKGEYMQMPLKGKPLMYEVNLKMSNDRFCKSEPIKTFAGEVAFFCEGLENETPETPETQTTNTPTTTNTPNTEPLNDYAKVCAKIKRLNLDVVDTWKNNTVSNEKCTCGWDEIEYSGWDIDGFIGICSTGWMSAGGEGYDSFLPWLKTKLKKSCSDLNGSSSYNMTDEYCECYGEMPLYYTDYVDNSDPSKDFENDCKGN